MNVPATRRVNNLFSLFSDKCAILREKERILGIRSVRAMQPKMCAKCKKNVAVVFITKVENGVTMNEGYCLKCARSLGIPQIDQAV